MDAGQLENLLEIAAEHRNLCKLVKQLTERITKLEAENAGLKQAFRTSGPTVPDVVASTVSSTGD